MLSIGKIVGVHGIHGNLKVFSYAESLSFYDSGNTIFIKTADGNERIYVIEHGAPHKKIILLSLEEVKDRESAKDFIGAELFIEKSVLPELIDDEYYWVDIIGCDVFSTDETYLGQVESIFPTGSNDVYVVKDPENGKETLIPALKSVIGEIDLDQKKMWVDLPEGL